MKACDRPLVRRITVPPEAEPATSQWRRRFSEIEKPARRGSSPFRRFARNDRHWQPNRKRAAPALDAFDLDRAAVLVHDLACTRQPNARAADAGHIAAATEAGKKKWQVVR